MSNSLKRKMADGQSEENAGPAETVGDQQQQQQKEFREKIAKMETELKEANQLCKIKDLENRALQSELEKQNLMIEHNALKAKFEIIEKEKEKQNEEGRYASVDQFTKLQNDLSGLIHELDVKEQQQQEEKGKYVSVDQMKPILDRINELEKQQKEQSKGEEKTIIDEVKKHQQMLEKLQVTTDSDLANAFQKKVAGLEAKQKKMESFIGLMNEQSEIVSANHLKPILDRISELEKNQQQQQDERGTSSTINSDRNPSNDCCWDVNACNNELEITGEKCLSVRYKENGNGCRSVFAKHSFSLNNNCSDIFYYEISVKQMKGAFNLGFANKHSPQMLDERIYRMGAFAYSSHGNFCINGHWKSRNSEHTFGVGDVVGCCVNLATRQIIFTKNGHRLDTTNYSISQSSADSPLFPIVSLYSFGDKIEANFEPSFKFETDI